MSGKILSHVDVIMFFVEMSEIVQERKTGQKTSSINMDLFTSEIVGAHLHKLSGEASRQWVHFRPPVHWRDGQTMKQLPDGRK